MSTTELREKLLATAELLATLEVPQVGTVHTRASISVHNIADRQSLAAWVRLMERPHTHRQGQSCWVNGRVGDVELSVFYTSGLLGEVVEPAGDEAIEALLS